MLWLKLKQLFDLSVKGKEAQKGQSEEEVTVLSILSTTSLYSV